MADKRPGGHHSQGASFLYHPMNQSGDIPSFAKREDTMFLDAVQPKDVLRGRIKNYKDDAQALRTTDISGTGPTYKHKRFHVDGPAYKDHIPGTASKTHYPEVRRPIDMSLTTVDIDKSWPDVVKFKTPRVVDPLAPNYPLPSASHRPNTPLRQRVHDGEVRDTLAHVGKSTPRIPLRSHYRDPNEARDIEYAQSNFRRTMRPLGEVRDIMKTADINGEVNLTMKKKTPRCTNPLDPEYEVDARTTHPLLSSEAHGPYAPKTQGFVHGAAPKPLTWDNGEPQTSLIKEDIAGTAPQRYKGCVPFNIYDPPEVTPYSKFYGCEDIEGARAGTRKGGPAR